MRRFLLAALAAAVLLCPQAWAQSFTVGHWAIFNQPAANTAATISKAAIPSRHVATSVTVCISAVAAQPDIIFNLRDGATGAGTVLWTARLAAAAGTSTCVPVLPLNILGSANTQMTL